MYKRQGLRQELFNKGIVAESALIFLPLIFSQIIITLTFFAQILDYENPSYIGYGVILVVAYFSGFTFVEQFRNKVFKNRAGITAGLEALDLISYFSNILLIFVIPAIIGIVVYFVAKFGFQLSHTISYFCGVGVAAPAYYLAFQILRPKKNRVKRGQDKGSHEEAKKKVDSVRAAKDEGIPFGDILLPSEAATKHFLVVGTTGSGKTVTIKLLINRVIRDILKRPEQKAVFFDAKRELYPYFLKQNIPDSKIHILNPFDQRFVAWDLSRDIDTKARARQFAHLLVPEPERKGDNSYFDDVARLIIQNVIHSFILTSEDRQERGFTRLKWTLRDVIIAPRYLPALKDILGKHKETAYVIHQHLENERTTRAILSSLDNALSEFEEVAALYEFAPKKKSLRRWVEEESGSILLLGWDKENEKAIEPLNRLIFQYISNLVLNQDNSAERRTWFFLDELRMLSKGLPGLYQLLNMGREKGACCVLGVIDIDGLNSAMGKDVAQEITSLCDSVAGLRTRGDTANWLSEMFGNAEIKEQNLSFDSKGRRSLQEHLTERKTFIKGEFQNLNAPSEENGYTISGCYMNAHTMPYFHAMPGVNGWFRKVPQLSREELNQGVVEHPNIKKMQRLKMWGVEDLKRLELNLDLVLLYNIEQDQEQTKQQKPKVDFSNFRMANDDEPEEDIEPDQEIENDYEQ